MAAAILRATSVFALLCGLATGLAGCSTSVEGDPTPVGGEPGGGGDLGATDGDGLSGSCEEGSCSVYEQCGCEAGQACDLDGADLAAGGTECRDVASPGQTESNCDTPDQCAAGYSCLGEPGQCRKMCDEDRDCGVGHCIVAVVFEADSGELETVPGANACTKQCDAERATGSGCPRDPIMGCRFYPYDEEGTGEQGYYTDCTPAGVGGDGADCSANSDDDCAPGFGCFVISYDDDTEKDECRQNCAFPAGSDAAAGVCGAGTCHPFDPPALVGDVEYGVCF
jgi:hypothetical protein